MDNKQKTHREARTRALKTQLSLEDSVKPNIERERFLALLKSRHGYANDQAAEQLEKYLTQSSKARKSRYNHRSHPVIQDEHAD